MMMLNWLFWVKGRKASPVSLPPLFPSPEQIGTIWRSRFFRLRWLTRSTSLPLNCLRCKEGGSQARKKERKNTSVLSSERHMDDTGNRQEDKKEMVFVSLFPQKVWNLTDQIGGRWVKGKQQQSSQVNEVEWAAFKARKIDLHVEAEKEILGWQNNWVVACVERADFVWRCFKIEKVRVKRKETFFWLADVSCLQCTD